MPSNIDNFIRWENRSLDSIDVKRCYIDVAGELVAGVLLSQIIFWYLPDKKGNSKLRVKHNGEYWIANKREDWWDEVRISPKQFDRCTSVLEKKGLIEVATFHFNGSPTKHIRLKWNDLLQALDDLPDMVLPQRSKWNSPLTNDTSHTGENGNYPKGNMELDQRGSSNLTKGEVTYIDPEITPENTPENISPLPPAGERRGERKFGFEISQEPLPESSATLLTKGEVTHEVANIVMKADVPPMGRTDKFFTGKTTHQKKYEQWAKTAHPALVYDGENTPWLEPPSGLEFIKFHQAFVDWHTTREMQKYHKQDRFQAEGDFKGALRNDPERCSTRWAEYHKHMVSHAVTAAARANSGMKITEVEKQKFIKNQRAFAKATEESTEQIDPKILAVSQQPNREVPQLESVTTVSDDIWDTVAATTKQEQAQFIQPPDDGQNVSMYQQIVKSEDSDYFRKLHEKQQNSAPADSTPITSLEEAKAEIHSLVSLRGMPRFTDAQRQRISDEERERSKLLRWAELLESGLPSVMADVEKQMSAQGYQIVDGQIVEVDF